MSGSLLPSGTTSLPGESASDRTVSPTSPEKSSYVLPRGVILWLGSKLMGLGLMLAGHSLLAILVYLSLDPWFLWQILRPTAGGFGRVAARFHTLKREIWLTIDDGPDPLTTPRVLKLLDDYNARATFFVIGENVRRHPELAAEIMRRGHTLANHTQTHPAASFWGAGPRRVALEIDGCNAALEGAGLPRASYFRAPVGIKTVFIHPALASRGMTLVAWSARGYDSVVAEQTATRRILRGLKPGAIVLLHEGRSDLSRVDVVERVLKGMRDAGFSTVIPDLNTLIF